MDCPATDLITTYKSNWKTTTFKKVCTGLGYRINPDREGNRWLKSVNGENKDFYQLVPQEGAIKVVLSTDAAEAPAEPPTPPVVENGEINRFDRVIANPKFSLKNWGRSLAENDGYGRYRYGVPPKDAGDLAFVQHMISLLNQEVEIQSRSNSCNQNNLTYCSHFITLLSSRDLK